ncbi:MAG TPA: septal ring lytic transglycosylase RlpA family protein [Beijerinckiaceae bacterium]|jgi:rare lipoprotein A
MAGARARGLEPPARAYQARGAAVWYAHKGRTASGQPFDPNALTAAHRSLPFGTKVRVTNRRNGRSVIVTINDRMGAGAKGAGVVIDLSRAAARAIGVEGRAEVVLHEAAPPPGDPVLASDR